jgi:hypothetical protein
MKEAGKVTEANGAVEAGQLADSDDLGWIQDYQSWQRGRLKRVQDSAGVWLGVLTTLLGLLGSVVLFKGGDLVTGVTDNGWFQFFLILLVGLVFVSAVLALIAGGSATWGGLADIAPPDGTTGAAADKAQEQADGPHLSSPDTGSNTAVDRSRLRRRWFAFWLMFSGEPPAERERLLNMPSRRRLRVAGGPFWQQYRTVSRNSADRQRAYLHASRGLGVASAILISVLAVVAVIAGTVSPAPAEVIVIHNGQPSCVTTAASSTFAHVTQIIPVNGC